MLSSMRKNLQHNPNVRLLYGGEDHVAGLVGSCLVLIARGEPGESITTEAPKWVDALLASYPGKCGGLIVLIQANASPPSEVARKRIDAAYHAYGRGVVAGAMVIEGTGFVAASIRSALSVLMLTSRYPYPMKTFATVPEGVALIAGKLTGNARMPASTIIDGVEALRKAYEKEVGRFTAGGGQLSA